MGLIWGLGTMIKIGIEVSCLKLRYDLLDNPGRYFFVLSNYGRAALCIQTCDFQGDDITTHIIDGFSVNKDGEPNALFDAGVNDSLLSGEEFKRHSSDGDNYPISPYLKEILCQLPDLMDWIISSFLIRGRNLVIHPVTNPFESRLKFYK